MRPDDKDRDYHLYVVGTEIFTRDFTLFEKGRIFSGFSTVEAMFLGLYMVLEPL